MNASEIHKTADLLKALGEFNRLSLVYNLCRCESSQNAMCLCDCCSVDASVVSRHLKVLAERDIVKFDKVGREKTYRLNRNEVAAQLRELADLIEITTVREVIMTSEECTCDCVSKTCCEEKSCECCKTSCCC